MLKVVTKQILQQALWEYYRTEFDSIYIEAANNPIQPSPEIDRRIRQAIKLRQKKYHRFIDTTGKRVAMIFWQFFCRSLSPLPVSRHYAILFLISSFACMTPSRILSLPMMVMM